MKMKNSTLNFNYYEFLIMYENETSPTLPFIYLFFFLEALQISFDLLENYS